MKKWRIKEKYGYFYPQKKFLWFWMSFDTDTGSLRFMSKARAENWIRLQINPLETKIHEFKE
jgi:hypothetical protein